MAGSLNGGQTRPLTAHALDALRRLDQGAEPAQNFNPGIKDRLTRGALAELVELPSPYQTHAGISIFS